jgi:hypothetical protein
MTGEMDAQGRLHDPFSTRLSGQSRGIMLATLTGV